MKMLSARNYKVISKGGTSTGYVIVKSLDMGNMHTSVTTLVSNWSKIQALLKQVRIYINLV